MRALRQCKTMVREALQGLWRNKAMGLASAVSITAVLLIFGIVLLMLLNVNKMVFDVGNRLDKVVLYLTDQVTPNEAQVMISDLETDPRVREVTYTSKEEALKDLKEQFGEDSYIFESLPEGYSLPASLTVSLKDISNVSALAEELGSMDGVDRVRYFNDLVERMITITDYVRIAGMAVVGILFFVAIVLIHNTIKVALTNRHREIQIMKYVGARNRYISGSFLLEGIFFGLTGALLATGILSWGYDRFIHGMGQQFVNFMGMQFFPLDVVVPDMLIIFICLGVGIGYLGSAISVKRFLDV